jgi:cation:H+ antiporter
MGGAYLIFLGQAVFRGREEPTDVQWSRMELALAAASLLALTLGAYGVVRATENIVAALSISN